MLLMHEGSREKRLFFLFYTAGFVGMLVISSCNFYVDSFSLLLLLFSILFFSSVAIRRPSPLLSGKKYYGVLSFISSNNAFNDSISGGPLASKCKSVFILPFLQQGHRSAS
jgi:hypothetical protein